MTFLAIRASSGLRMTTSESSESSMSVGDRRRGAVLSVFLETINTKYASRQSERRFTYWTIARAFSSWCSGIAGGGVIERVRWRLRFCVCFVARGVREDPRNSISESLSESLPRSAERSLRGDICQNTSIRWHDARRRTCRALLKENHCSPI